MKQWFLDVAEVIDALRIIPRLALIWYGWFTTVVFYEVLRWYTSLNAAQEKTVADGGVIVGVFTAVTAVGGYVFRSYTEGGRDWSKQRDPDGDNREQH
jgi:hypothetical protein